MTDYAYNGMQFSISFKFHMFYIIICIIWYTYQFNTTTKLTIFAWYARKIIQAFTSYVLRPVFEHAYKDVAR